jgi:hypothetical protein
VSGYRFSPQERFAVFTAHRERCYISHTSLTLLETEIDHVIPESLGGNSAELDRAVSLLGRPVDFSVNTPANWSPACRRCNVLKSDRLWDPSLLVQLHLQAAAERAPKVVELIHAQVTQREIGRALNLLERAAIERNQDVASIAGVRALLSAQRPFRDKDIRDSPLMIAPEYGVVTEGDGITVVRGPYGVGGRPSMPDPHSSFDCPNCGSLAAWEGARCVLCGMLSDE